MLPCQSMMYLLKKYFSSVVLLIFRANLKPGINGTVVLEIPLSRSPMPSRYGNHSNQGYSSSSSSCSSASSSSCSQIPNKALFPHPQHLLGRGVGLGSREDSPSLSDESSSPADSPQPSDNHSPRVDIGQYYTILNQCSGQ